jgi:hypothetical protein
LTGQGGVALIRVNGEGGMAREGLIGVLKIQSGVCTRMGAPFCGDFLARAAEDVAAGGIAAELLAPFAESDVRQLLADAAALRFLGAFHELALSGEIAELTAAYPAPGRSGDGEAAWAIARAAAKGRKAALAAFMGHEPQTTEVRRSICLLGGFLEVAKATGLPLSCLELGASAGLNQSWDQFRYDLGGRAVWGPAGSPVSIDAEWSGPLPALDAPISVADRAACDRAPVDARDPRQRRRLKAFLWADQFDRLARFEAAADLAVRNAVVVEGADAVDWTRAHAQPRPGQATVVYHSVFWQYVPPQGRAALQAAIETHGAAASEAAPLAWLRMEPPMDDLARMQLRLTLWPGGEERLLAEVHPHGAAVQWQGAA